MAATGQLEGIMKTFLALTHDEWFRSVVNIVIGFFIAQLAGSLGERRERKKAASRALTELLELRHHLVAMEAVRQAVDQMITVIGNIPETDRLKLLVVLESLLPKPDDLHSRYDQSVSALAPSHPLLAFELRSKDLIRPLLTTLRSLMSQDAQAAAVMGPFLKQNVLVKIEPNLNKYILLLAWKAGFVCWYNTRRALLNQREPISPELQEYLDSFKRLVEEQKKHQAAFMASVSDTNA